MPDVIRNLVIKFARNLVIKFAGLLVLSFGLLILVTLALHLLLGALHCLFLPEGGLPPSAPWCFKCSDFVFTSRFASSLFFGLSFLWCTWNLEPFMANPRSSCLSCWWNARYLSPTHTFKYLPLCVSLLGSPSIS